MAKRGPPPKPTHLKLVTCTARRHRLNQREPRPEPCLPDPPDFVEGEAHEEWQRAGRLLHDMGVLAATDRAVLAAYCCSFGLWVETERLLARMAAKDMMSNALMIKTTNGNIIQNPLVGVARRAKADMVRYAVELGMTPASRSRVDGHGGNGSDPADRFFS